MQISYRDKRRLGRRGRGPRRGAEEGWWPQRRWDHSEPIWANSAAAAFARTTATTSAGHKTRRIISSTSTEAYRLQCTSGRRKKSSFLFSLFASNAGETLLRRASKSSSSSSSSSTVTTASSTTSSSFFNAQTLFADNVDFFSPLQCTTTFCQNNHHQTITDTWSSDLQHPPPPPSLHPPSPHPLSSLLISSVSCIVPTAITITPITTPITTLITPSISITPAAPAARTLLGLLGGRQGDAVYSGLLPHQSWQGGGGHGQRCVARRKARSSARQRESPFHQVPARSGVERHQGKNGKMGTGNWECWVYLKLRVSFS